MRFSVSRIYFTRRLRKDVSMVTSTKNRAAMINLTLWSVFYNNTVSQTHLKSFYGRPFASVSTGGAACLNIWCSHLVGSADLLVMLNPAPGSDANRDAVITSLVAWMVP